jgi:predicted alpha/beta-fold hydrolase
MPIHSSHATVEFHPFPLLGNPHTQTIAARLGRRRQSPSERRLVELDDADRLAVEISTPQDWCAGDRTALLVHGLCGCHMSHYMVRLAARFYQLGVRAVRVNQRGCGSGRALARQPYHSGRSDDVLAVLQMLRDEMPESPMTVIGFSLGANLVLKMAGELGHAAAGFLEQIVAVCPPSDLATCAARLCDASNRLYDRYFVGLLRADVAFRHRTFPDLAPVDLPRRLNLRQFDELYTAPRCGFADAADYYERSSSAPLVPRVEVPCQILLARDDPLIDSTTFDGVDLPEHVHVVKTDRGGHLGFLGTPGRPGGVRWMDWWVTSQVMGQA